MDARQPVHTRNRLRAALRKTAVWMQPASMRSLELHNAATVEDDEELLRVEQ